MRSTIIQGIVVISSLSMFGCFQGETPTSEATAEAQGGPGVNNSDPGKANYHPMTAQEKIRYDKKVEMLSKIYPASSERLATSAAAKSAATSDVGILETGASGPSVDIFMDTENDGNQDELYTQGSGTNQTSITGIDRLPLSNRNGGVMFHVKKLSLSSLPRLQYDYITFLFSENCPANGYRFSEVFDNEDTNNQDYASSSVAPGWSDRNRTGTMLKFCFVPGTGTNAGALPPWLDSYSGNYAAVIALPNKTYYDYTSTVYPFHRVTSCNLTQEAWLDGEDDGFAGYFDYEQVPANYQANVAAMTTIQWGAPHFYLNSCRPVPPQP